MSLQQNLEIRPFSGIVKGCVLPVVEHLLRSRPTDRVDQGIYRHRFEIRGCPGQNRLEHEASLEWVTASESEIPLFPSRSNSGLLFGPKGPTIAILPSGLQPTTGLFQSHHRIAAVVEAIGTEDQVEP